MMKVVSVNLSLPKEVKWKGTIVSTGIFKEPVHHRVEVRRLNIEGDKQADLTVHGGPDKAIYAYAAEHYSAWKIELDRPDLPWGMFGENLTIEGGFFEDVVFVGDRYSVGTAEVIAVQPRLPCYKLGIRFGTQRILNQFAASGRLGVYFRVVKEGNVGPGDAVSKIAESKCRVSIADVGHILLDRDRDPILLRRVAEEEFLPEEIRAHVNSLLDQITS